MKLNVCLLVFSLLAVFTSCNRENERESKASLYSAAQVMEYDPVEAQHRLKTVRKISLPDADYAYYVLVKARVAERNGVNIAPLAETVAEARDFFEKEGEASKVAFAHFVLAKVYEAQQNAAKELYYYMQADDWAGKANNQLPNFSYSSIPYNIALCLYDNRHYEESLQYLEKALSHTDSNEPSQLHDKMFFLELKATNYQMLAGEDSALYYYDLALDLARQFKDAPAENRILFNKYALLYNTEKYEMAEKRCKELLPQLLESRDSLHLGKTNIILARIYAKSNRLDSASTSIGKAVAFLENAKGDARLSLYETLTLVEQKKGNHAKANGYQRQYNEYKTQLEDKRRTEQAELAKKVGRGAQAGGRATCPKSN